MPHFHPLSIIAVLALNGAWWNRWEIPLLLGGMLIAETDLIAADRRRRGAVSGAQQ